AIAVRDGRRIAVFTSPTPPRVGTIDISILVQDQATGRPLLDVPMTVVVYPSAGDKKKFRSLATQEAATNKLMRATQFDLNEVGPWQVEVAPQYSSGDPLRFTIEVQDAAPAWLDMRLWLLWPVAAIALFALHQWLEKRKYETGRQN